MNKSKTKSKGENRIELGKLHHICLAVKDVEKTAKAFSAIFGISPFKMGLFETPSTMGILYGKPQGWRIKIGNTKVSPIVLELQQTVGGETASNDFLKIKGEGLHHIAFECNPPIDDEIAKWKRNGIEALQIDKSFDDPRYGWAYMDTSNLVGCILELLCLPPNKRDM